MRMSGPKRAWLSGLAQRGLVVPRPRQRKARAASVDVRTPMFVVDIALSSGADLHDRLVEQGLAPDEVIFKYVWPRYEPPADSGIRSLMKSENLGRQFERLVAMHLEVPSGAPMPLATVRNVEGAFVGYLLERVEGETLQSLIDFGALAEARRQLDAVERTVGTLHARSMPHGDLNASNIIAADDGRTLLIDPVAYPGPGTKLEDEICLRRLRELISG